MKAKDLINELKKYDGDTEIAIYNRATGGALWIPNYDFKYQVAPDKEFAQEFDLDEDTVFITGK
ncbi:hypothetical protein [Pediococcus pentosaceus]|uniref:hypothetical protein n=1 Tax=Pediococcus pentosaceus TaxID=1255 RepID=UPI001F58B932|nr:hypothetical protein [Pediococcus pentosaceus]MCI2960316.1 hypothetical protein [Pediococcus pentosaceus]